jgi:hypothetical protein
MENGVSIPNILENGEKKNQTVSIEIIIEIIFGAEDRGKCV